MGLKYTVDNNGILTLTNNLIVDVNDLYVDTVLNRVGVGTATPAHRLDAAGDINTTGLFLVNGSQISSSNLSDGGSLIAYALKDTTGSVDVSAAAAPSINQVLTATSATTATWQTPGSSIYLVGTGLLSIVGFGSGNTADGDYSVNGGGQTNLISAAADWAHIGGGFNNQTTALYSVIGGGAGNVASSTYAVIAGGINNTVSGGAGSSALCGGSGNSVLAESSYLGGGINNSIAALALDSTISGGSSNTIATGGVGSTISGGNTNTSAGAAGTIGGGVANTIIFGSGQCTIAGGSTNTANSSYASVGGGYTNQATGAWSTIPGGDSNTADGPYSFAAGRRAKVGGTTGAYVWADSTNADFTATVTDSYVIRASGGVGIGTPSPDPVAILQADSTTKGFLPPRMTTTQRDAISSPPVGLTIFNTTTNTLETFTA
jgi:hypothetical protein